MCNMKEAIGLPHALAWPPLPLVLPVWVFQRSSSCRCDFLLAPEPAPEPDRDIPYYDAKAVLAGSITDICRQVGLTQLTQALITFGSFAREWPCRTRTRACFGKVSRPGHQQTGSLV